MYDKMKELTKKCTQKCGGSITDKNGKILFDQEEIAKRWFEYIKELYDDALCKAVLANCSICLEVDFTACVFGNALPYTNACLQVLVLFAQHLGRTTKN